MNRFVLLLQEAYRPAGGAAQRPRQAGLPRAMRPARASPPLDMPSRPGAPGCRCSTRRRCATAPAQTDEDRGNAILSTEPLADLTAIELPFERQRRVAVAATLQIRGTVGEAWPLRVASVHLENTASARRLRVLAPEPRRRQAAGLLAVLPPTLPLLVGGDLNTWFGYLERTYKTMAGAVPDIGTTDRRPTFARFLRLDHVFARLPDGWTAKAIRLADNLGSDHYPILARVRAPGPPPVAGPK